VRMVTGVSRPSATRVAAREASGVPRAW
jgi:hypothetical protein